MQVLLPLQPYFNPSEAEAAHNCETGMGPCSGSIERQYEIADEIADKISAGEAEEAAKKAQEEWDAKHPKKPRKSKVQHRVNSNDNLTQVVNDVATARDGQLNVNIDTRHHALQGYRKGEWAKIIKRMIIETLSGKSLYAIDGEIITITERGARELAYGTDSARLTKDAKK